MIKKIKVPRKLAPSHVTLLSLLFTLFVGTVLLSLPISQLRPIPFIDVIFTATSVITGTGLLTVPIIDFSPFGLAVIVILIQIGALGLITLSLFFFYFLFDVDLVTEILASQILALRKKRNLAQIIHFIMLFTFGIEFIGAAILMFSFAPEYGWSEGFFMGLFHSISAFSNAGVSLFLDNLVSYNQDSSLMVTMSILMILGGIGFITLREFIDFIPRFIKRKKYSFSLGTKIVWTSTLFLTIFSTVMFFFLEQNNTLADTHGIITWFNALFNGVASSGTGYHTVYPRLLQTATLLMIMVIAFIGTSPGSTGSGIRTTTTVIFLATLKSVILGKKYVTIGNKRISRYQVNVAQAIIALSIPWVLFSTFCLLLTDRDFKFISILFESVSAFATLGMSTGITPLLSTLGKIILMISMILGRIGPFTIIFAIRKTIKPERITAKSASPVLLTQ